jgi:hypothetical protein
MGARLENQVGQQRQDFSSWLGRGTPLVRKGHRGRAKQCQSDTRHKTTLLQMLTNLRAIHEGARGIHAAFTDAIQIVTWFSVIYRHPKRRSTMTAPANFRMVLTPEQKDQVRKATGKDAEVIELSVEELEERIAPAKRTALL